MRHFRFNTLAIVVFILFTPLLSITGHGYAAGELPEVCTKLVTPDDEKGRLDQDKNREIKDNETVCLGEGTYVYNFVNIHSGGKFILADANIHVWAKSILVEKDGSLIAGTQSAPITNRITIHLYGDKQEKDGIKCKSDPITCGTTSDLWENGNNEKHTLDNGIKDYFYKYSRLPTDDKLGLANNAYFGLKVLAVSYGGNISMFGAKGATNASLLGHLQVAQLKKRVTKGDRHLELSKFVDWKPGTKIRLIPKDGSSGPSGFYTIGDVHSESSDYHTSITIRESGIHFSQDSKKEYVVAVLDPSGTSWARLDKSLAKGDRTLILDREVDWQAGDRIVVTTTDYLPSHSEELTIVTIADKKTITVKEDVKYPHNGEAYDLTKHNLPSRLTDLGGLFKAGKVETRAAVALLTRNIRIVSEMCSSYDPVSGSCPGLPPSKCRDNKYVPDDPDCSGMPAVPGNYFGGHTIVRQGFNKYQMQGVEFRQLGQGGRMAHAPINFHLTREVVPDNTFVRDCSVNESMAHWIELRGTQKVTLERNVGYNSIGHGYYLVDGSEAENVLRANIGIHARAAVNSGQNPRLVPGIVAMTSKDRPDLTPKKEYQQFQGDALHPSVFLITNAWNTFEHNMAVGAGTCGACYWILPSRIGGLSVDQNWSGYAGIQAPYPENRVGPLGKAPLKTFLGNFCSTAQYSLITIGGSGTCEGVTPILNEDTPVYSGEKLVPIQNEFASYYFNATPNNLYPDTTTAANFSPVLWDGHKDDPKCVQGQTDDCPVSVIESFTSSFHWAQQNFAAVWLRDHWFLVTDSALTDVLNGGLTMVSGGSYDQVINGYWALTRNSVFIGNTQSWDPSVPSPGSPGNAYASPAGPFNTYTGGLSCDSYAHATSYCLSRAEGISMPIDTFGVYQRLYNIYDGPTYQDNNAYLQIRKLPVNKCGDGKCDSQYMFGSRERAKSIPRSKEDPYKGECVLPNAAIGWKQPNGFYYPPAFHSRNLYFDKVDLRHYIIVPLFKPGTADVYTPWVDRDYCYYPEDKTTLFANDYTDVDRQTELNDDDGSLSGLATADPAYPGLDSTISVNKDKFYLAPSITMECGSDQTCFQAPYDYVTAVVYPNQIQPDPTDLNNFPADPKPAYCHVCDPDKPNEGKFCSVVDRPGRQRWDNNWCNDCQQRNCYGVPIYRQFYTAEEKTKGIEKDPGQSMRMMGAGIWQRSTMLANLGKYYIDTAVSKKVQFDKTRNSDNVGNINVFEPNKSYNFFFLYSKPSTRVTFQMYVGKGLDKESFLGGNVGMVRAGTLANRPGEDNVVVLRGDKLQFTPVSLWPTNWPKSYDPDKGILEVTVDMGFDKAGDEATKNLANDFGDKAKKETCKPKSFCRWDDNVKKCCALANTERCDDSICYWSNRALDCPSGGCLGFKVTFPDTFIADDMAGGKYRPDTEPYPAIWNVGWKYADKKYDGDLKSCIYDDRNKPANVTPDIWDTEAVKRMP
jgi:hypothetical protein